MKAVAAKLTRGLGHRAVLIAADNSGARLLRLIAVKGRKTRKGRYIDAGVGDFVWGSVIDGSPELKGKVVTAIIVRQRRPWRRADGTRIAFESNAAVLIKDEFGNPQGTLIRGPVAREAAERWPPLAKLARVIV